MFNNAFVNGYIKIEEFIYQNMHGYDLIKFHLNVNESLVDLTHMDYLKFCYNHYYALYQTFIFMCLTEIISLVY